MRIAPLVLAVEVPEEIETGPAVDSSAEAPALITTSPPGPLLPDPAATLMLPLRPTNARPVVASNAPLDVAVVLPVANRSCPLAPAAPASALVSATEPPEPAALLPEESFTLPPDNAVLLPARAVISPPTPVSPAPTARTMPPPRPPDDAPEVMANEPDDANAAFPECNWTPPLEPVDSTSPDAILTLPPPSTAAPAPLVTVTLPPNAASERPASSSNAPPEVSVPLDLPT